MIIINFTPLQNDGTIDTWIVFGICQGNEFVEWQKTNLLIMTLSQK